MSWSQGYYKVINRNKYLGTMDKKYNLTNADPFYRSSWEKRLMYKFDKDPNVLRWGYENIIIPYTNYDGKVHRYIMDFYIEALDKNNNVKKILIEVKPRKDGEPPKKPKIKNIKAMNRYMYEAKTYITNKNKWKSAKLFCEKKGMIFKIMTEKELFRQHKK